MFFKKNKVSTVQKEIGTVGFSFIKRDSPENNKNENALMAETMIDKKVVIEGNFSSDGSVLFQGKITGDIRVSNLIVGKDAIVNGTITSLSLDILGSVTGLIDANEVRLAATAVVKGDINHHCLCLEKNAHFEGVSRRIVTELASVSKDEPPSNTESKINITAMSFVVSSGENKELDANLRNISEQKTLMLKE